MPGGRAGRPRICAGLPRGHRTRRRSQPCCGFRASRAAACRASPCAYALANTTVAGPYRDTNTGIVIPAQSGGSCFVGEVKAPGEVEAIEAAGQVVAQILAAVGSQAAPGVRLTELDGTARDVLAQAGAT